MKCQKDKTEFVFEARLAMGDHYVCGKGHEKVLTYADSAKEMTRKFVKECREVVEAEGK